MLVTLHRVRLVLSWATVLFRHYTILVCNQPPSQCSLLSSLGWEMSTDKRAVKLNGLEVKAGTTHSTNG